jgi:hypothetical protein
MIHEIVSSDVELARGMMDSGRSDTEILAYLASRSVEPAKAAQLVDDLRHGRQPSTQLPFEFRPAAHHAVAGRRTATAEAQPAQPSHRKRSGSGKHKRSAIPWWFVVLVAITLLALGYLLLGPGSSAPADAINNEKHEIPPPPDK